MAFDQPSLKSRALRLLATREYSRAELQRKLAPFEDAAGALAAALDELQAKGFIDEQRVLASVLNRSAAKLGTARIQQELHKKGLAPQAVADALAALRATELERAQAVWRKKFHGAPADASAYAKQARFLAARGFSSELVRRLLSQAGHPPSAQSDADEYESNWL